MNAHQAHDTHDCAALGTLMKSAMSGILAKLKAGFDPEAGLADIYARQRAAYASTEPRAQACPAAPAPPEPRWR